MICVYSDYYVPATWLFVSLFHRPRFHVMINSSSFTFSLISLACSWLPHHCTTRHYRYSWLVFVQLRCRWFLNLTLFSSCLKLAIKSYFITQTNTCWTIKIIFLLNTKVKLHLLILNFYFLAVLQMCKSTNSAVADLCWCSTYN